MARTSHNASGGWADTSQENSPPWNSRLWWAVSHLPTAISFAHQYSWPPFSLDMHKLKPSLGLIQYYIQCKAQELWNEKQSFPSSFYKVSEGIVNHAPQPKKKKKLSTLHMLNIHSGNKAGTREPMQRGEPPTQALLRGNPALARTSLFSSFCSPKL